ncbi:MAG: PPC domain-containing protein [Synechococcales cyanobacterium T60_A2020_003]|nr:PPC domain-containing protein [Synechococcales cyanobacterium T60_A2020_003]
MSPSNQVDVFKVNVSKTSSVSASLSKLKANATIQLFDKKKSAVDQASFTKGGQGRGILRNLTRGIYYLQVSLTKGKKTAYELQLDAAKPRVPNRATMPSSAQHWTPARYLYRQTID